MTCRSRHIDLNSSWSVLPGGTLPMYNYFGGVDEIEQALILPGLQETQKALSAKYDAYDLQQKAVAIADEAKGDMNKWLTESLKMHGLPNDIDVATVLFPHVEFSPEFKAATTEQTQGGAVDRYRREQAHQGLHGRGSDQGGSHSSRPGRGLPDPQERGRGDHRHHRQGEVAA